MSAFILIYLDGSAHPWVRQRLWKSALRRTKRTVKNHAPDRNNKSVHEADWRYGDQKRSDHNVPL
jgi:hypothetical protein